MKYPPESFQKQNKSFMRVAGIIDDSMVDGPGIRYAIFLQGCSHNCQGCHNPATHDYNSGNIVNIDDIISDIKNYKYINAVTFSGGEPLDQPEAVEEAVIRLKAAGYHIMIYSGYTYEEITSDSAKYNAIKNADILVDGRFINSKKSLSLRFRGSFNQRVIDIQATMSNKHVTLINDEI